MKVKMLRESSHHPLAQLVIEHPADKTFKNKDSCGRKWDYYGRGGQVDGR